MAAPRTGSTLVRSMRRMIVVLSLFVALSPGLPARAQLYGRSVYFAEGTTRAGFSELLSFLNTNQSAITITLEYQFADGAPAVSREVSVDPRTLTFVNPAQDPDVGVRRDISVVASSP